MIKFYAFVYRLTGWYMPQARLLEYEHLKASLDEISADECKMSLRNMVGLYIGMWQAKHGFTRPYKRTKLFKESSR